MPPIIAHATHYLVVIASDRRRINCPTRSSAWSCEQAAYAAATPLAWQLASLQVFGHGKFRDSLEVIRFLVQPGRYLSPDWRAKANSFVKFFYLPDLTCRLTR